jgi:hypothetical protein
MTSLVLDGRTQSRDAMLQKMVNARHDIMALEDIRFVKVLHVSGGMDSFLAGLMNLFAPPMRIQEVHLDCCSTDFLLMLLCNVTGVRSYSIRMDTPCAIISLRMIEAILKVSPGVFDLNLELIHPSYHWSDLHDFPKEHAAIVNGMFKSGIKKVRFESFAFDDDSIPELLAGLKQGTRPAGCKFTLASGLTSSCELSVCINNVVGTSDERDLLFLEVLEPNPHLQEHWHNSCLTEDDLKPKLRHWLDSHQIGQMLLHAPEHQENAVVSPLCHRWPLVLERVNGLFRLPEATEERRRANAIYHLLQGSQPTGTLLSALLSEGRLGNEEED